MTKWLRRSIVSIVSILVLLQPDLFQPRQIVFAAPHLETISSAAGLAAISANLSGTYTLSQDIDLSTIPNWTPLGDTTTAFTGSLNGNGHTIRNLSLSNTQTGYQGLFGVIGVGGSVNNVLIENARVTAADNAGILAGENRGNIEKVGTNGIISGATNVGGLVGSNTGTISKAFAIASVSGKTNNGGLVGSNSGTISITYSASTVKGAVTNNYLQFDGVDDYIDIPNNAAYRTNSFTIEAWFNWNPVTGKEADVNFIISKGLENFEIHTGGDAGAYGIRFIPVSAMNDTTYRDGRAYQDAKKVLQPGWNHVASVFDYEHQTAQVYWNGIPQDIYQLGVNKGITAPLPLSHTDPLINNTNHFYIGKRNDPPPYQYHFPGNISDVRLWNRPLSASEIADNKDKPLQGNEPGLIGYWKLNDTTGTTAIDSSTVGNNGVINGATRIQVPSVNGGLVAVNTGTVEKSYYDTTVSGLNDSSIPGITPFDTDHLMSSWSFPDPAWVFSDTEWNITNGKTYPTLFKHATSVSITGINPSTAVTGQNYTVSYSVANTYIGQPSGTVTVTDTGTGSCFSVLSSSSPSSGSCPLSSSSAMNTTLTATFNLYNGDHVFAPTTVTQSYTINQADTATTISSVSTGTSVVGEAYTVNVAVAAASPGSGTPTGSVEVSDGSGATCSIETLTAGAGSCQLTSTTKGTKALTATYAGDSSYKTSTTAASTSHTVDPADTTTTITSDTPDPSANGQTYTVGVSVAAVSPSSGTPTGTVDVADDDGQTCTVTLSSGSGSCSLVSSGVESKTITATYAGTDDFNGSSDTESHDVGQADSTTTITADSPDPSRVGEPYTVSVSVAAKSPATGTPGGTVTVKDSPTGATCTADLTGGIGSCDLTSATAGTKTLSADYNGGIEFKASSDADGESHTVNKAATTTTIADPSTVSVVGQKYTVSVDVTANSPGSGTPTGTVEVKDSPTGTPCTFTLNAGTGSCELTSTTRGTKTLSAVYSGDDNFNASSDGDGASKTVDQAQTETIIVSDLPNPSNPDETVTFKFKVNVETPGAGTPTGTVDLAEDSNVLCSGTLNASAEATCTTAAGFSAGEHTLTASYSGDTNFAQSTSAGLTHNGETIELGDNQTSTNFTSIGVFSTTGGSGPYSYSLQTTGSVCATHGAGNGSFEINATTHTLARKAATGTGTYSICVQSQDSSAGIVQKAFSIIISDPPSLTSSSLSKLTVGVTGTEVGTLTVTGGHGPFTYSLETTGSVCSLENSSGNNAFSISADKLNRESATTAGEYKVCVQVTDAENDVAQYAYNLTVNDGPGSLSITPTSASTAHTTVGDFGETGGLSPFTYSLVNTGSVCSSKGSDNARFSVNDSKLERVSSTPAGTYSICAQVTDQNGMTQQAAFSITLNDPPSDIALSSLTVSDTQTLVGTLSATDGKFPFTYSLASSGSVCAAGHAADNALFTIEGNGLKRSSSTSAGAYTVCLQTSDANGDVYQEEFNVSVTHDATPAVAWNVELTGTQVIDSDPLGTVVGSLVSTLDGTTFSLVDQSSFPMATNFAINPHNELILNNSISLSDVDSLPIRIRATAPDGKTKDLDVVITVMKNGTTAGASAENDSGSLSQGGTIRLDPTENDQVSTGATSWNSLQIVGYPDHGTAQIGSIIYTPDPGFYGTDVVTYRACDDLGYCVLGTVTFTINHIEETASDEVLDAKILPKTGFAPNQSTLLTEPSPEMRYFALGNPGTQIRLEIPKLGVNVAVVGVPVVNGQWETDWLGKEAGWLQGSAFPGWAGNSALAGHITTADGLDGPFAQLSKLQWGDQVIVWINAERNVYEIRETYPNLGPNDTRVLHHEKLPWLTLITCNDYDVKTGKYLSRTVVRAVLIKVEN
jgi:LPXTG-site transpeptidase (sortase) family protein